MSRNRKLWLAAMGLGFVLLLVGIGWIVYAAIGASTHYDASTGDYVSDSWSPIIGFVITFAGGSLISVAMIGWMFSWFSGDDDDRGLTEPSAMLRQAVPTTRVGWGPDPEENAPHSR
jgi:hypothetical protein